MQRAVLILIMIMALAPAGVSPVHAAPGPVAVVCVDPSSSAAFHRRATAATLALRAEMKQRGRKLVDPSTALHSAAAPPTALLEGADEAMKLGIEEYDSLEFGKATVAFLDAVGKLREAMQQTPEGVERARYVKALHYLGAAAHYNGDQAGAKEYFGDALAYAPGEGLDDAVFPPDLGEVFEGVKAEGGARGAVKVVSTPGAEVYVDGQPAGATPLVVGGLTPGRHLVRIQEPGHVPASRWVQVQAEMEAGVEINLPEGDRLPAFVKAVAVARVELGRGRPGKGARRLGKLLGVKSLVLVTARRKGVVQATWAEGGFWVKRYQTKVAEGREPLFASRFFERGTAVVAGLECRDDSDCEGGRSCSAGRCLDSARVGTPIYKKWWFWTIVGAVVVGGTVGAVVGSQPDKWTASVTKGVWP